MRKLLPVPALAALVAFGSAAYQSVPASAADEYGKITGRFVFEGEVPDRRVIIKKGDAQVKDAQVCAAQDLLASDLIVDPQSKGIKDVFVYLRSAPKDVHPDLESPDKPDVEFDQKNCEFIPHALVVRTDQDVVVKSNDPVPHNTHTYAIKNESFNFIVRPNDRVGVPISHKTGEILPIEVKCDFHPHMKAYWLIVDHPYAVVSNDKGEFEIDKLPAGKHEFRVWHERVGYVERSLKVEVEPDGVTDLGEIKVPAAKFEK
jgi:hypothetical protein